MAVRHRVRDLPRAMVGNHDRRNVAAAGVGWIARVGAAAALSPSGVVFIKRHNDRGVRSGGPHGRRRDLLNERLHLIVAAADEAGGRVTIQRQNDDGAMHVIAQVWHDQRKVRKLAVSNI